MMLPENELPLFERPAAATDQNIFINSIVIYTDDRMQLYH